MTKPIVNLKLDSGAYSAFTRGKIIDLEEYCDFNLAHKDALYSTVNLDVIDPKDPEVAAEAGFMNLLRMQQRGIDAMPVFHARESMQWLDEMMKVTSYVGISGTSLVSPDENIQWHRLVFDYITDLQGRAYVKTHSFGDTSKHILGTYPFFSADSSTWTYGPCKAASFYMQGKLRQLRSKKMRSNCDHFSLSDPQEKKDVWLAEIAGMGMNADKLMTAPLRSIDLQALRSYLNVHHIKDMHGASRGVQTYRKHASLLSLNPPGHEAMVGHVREAELVRMFYATPSSNWRLAVLTAHGISDVLISYFYLERSFWPHLEAWLYDPIGQMETNPKFTKYWELLNSFLLTPVTKENSLYYSKGESCKLEHSSTR